MDEFKPEDELKPDTSDRRPQRSRKTSSAPKIPVSRQHMMMGIGILVLLLLVIGIGSALNSPDDGGKKQAQQPPTQPSGSEKSIDLSGSSSMSGQNGAPDADGSAVSGSQAPANNAPQPVSVPPVSSTPTEAQPVPAPENQQRVELPGDLNSALNNQQGQIDAAAQGTSPLPTAPATVAPGGQSAATAPGSHAERPAGNQPQRTRPAAHKSAETKPSAKTSPATKAPQGSSTAAGRSAEPSKASGSTPGGSYTLQLSSASRSDTLNAWAKKQNLSGYHVYKTNRNGQPWYVLVSGSYATPADAKRAVASLPAEVRAQNPWVKPVSQVKKEAAN